MKMTLPTPRLLPLTVTAMAALLGLKSVVLVRAAIPAEPARAAAPAAAKPTAEPAKADPGKPDPGKAGPAHNEPVCRVDTSVPAALPVSDSERALLLDLRGRRSELDSQANALSVREASLNAAEKRLAGRLVELNALQQRLEALEADRHAREEANWNGLVKLYEQMRPRDAATIFNDLDPAVLLPVLDRMKAAKAAPVLAAMQTERARMATAELAQMRARAVTPPGPAAPQEKP